MDSTEFPVRGQQEQSAYNRHFESTCYHPLLLFNREGDFPHHRQRQFEGGHRGAADAASGSTGHKPLVLYKGFLYQAAS